MIKRITLNDFRKGFKDMNRDSFSYEGYEALYDYLEELEDGSGSPIEFDVIALDGEYAEYGSLKEFNEDYCGDPDEYETIEELREDTTAIEFDGGLIVQQF